MASCVQHTLEINCGFACCAIRELTPKVVYGTQQDGRFKCGGCGTRDIMFGDLVHIFQQPWRSLHDLQVLSTAGEFGKSVGNPKLFDNLRVARLREELHT